MVTVLIIFSFGRPIGSAVAGLLGLHDDANQATPTSRRVVVDKQCRAGVKPSVRYKDSSSHTECDVQPVCWFE